MTLDEHIPDAIAASATGAGELGLLDRLTAREGEVAIRIAEGKDRHQVADELGISTKTFDTHRLHVLQKLGCRNAVELALRCVREGLVIP